MHKPNYEAQNVERVPLALMKTYKNVTKLPNDGPNCGMIRYYDDYATSDYAILSHYIILC